MKRKFVVMIIALLALSVFSMETFAYGGRQRRKPRRKHGIMKILKNPIILKKAGISAEKAKKIKAIFREAAKKNIMLKARAKVEKINLRIEFERATVNQEAVLAIVKKISDLKAQIAQNRAIAKVKAINTLTVQEREKLKEVLLKYAFKRMHRGPHCGPMGRHNRPMMQQHNVRPQR